MKKLIILVACFSVFAASQCKKKEVQDFLPGDWGILTFKENDIDKTSSFNIAYQGYKLSFDAKGRYTEFYHPQGGVETTITGTWTLENDNSQLVLADDNPSSTKKLRTMKVLHELSSTNLDLGEDNKEYDLRKQ